MEYLIFPFLLDPRICFQGEGLSKGLAELNKNSNRHANTDRGGEPTRPHPYTKNYR